MLDPRIEEWLLNPPPGSKAAAAKEFGIDLTLLLRQMRLTPQQRLDELQNEMISLQKLDAQVKSNKKQKGEPTA